MEHSAGIYVSLESSHILRYRLEWPDRPGKVTSEPADLITSVQSD
jgi:hypothetical protein